MNKCFLNTEEAVLVIVDIQEKLAAVMTEREKVTSNCLHLMEAARLFDLPVIITEQYPKGLGPTVPEIKEAAVPYAPLEKITFDCCREPTFTSLIKATGRKKIILAGMETHICVLQTCIGLLEEQYDLHVVNDAVCSRTKENYGTGIEMMRDAGAVITCTETVLFQLLEKAGTEEFRTISKRIK